MDQGTHDPVSAPTAALAGRCQHVLATLNQECNWQMDADALQRFVEQLLPELRAEDDAAQLRRIILNYHADHAHVAALRQEAHPQHQAAWQSWASQVLAILHSNGLHWSSDGASDPEDLVQSALVELTRSLARFGYRSRFSTWAFQVIVHSAHRHLQARRAQKRSVVPASLEALPSYVGAALVHERAEAEAVVAARLLHTQIIAILRAQPDQRLAYIFHLWAVEDRHIDDIGGLLHLHPSRVRRLLFDARQVLRAHPAIRAWYGGDG